MNKSVVASKQHFVSLMWALTRHGGRSTIDDLLGDSALVSSLASTRRKLTRRRQALSNSYVRA